MNFTIAASNTPYVFLYIFVLTFICLGLIIWIYIIDKKRSTPVNEDILADQIKQLSQFALGDTKANVGITDKWNLTKPIDASINKLTAIIEKTNKEKATLNAQIEKLKYTVADEIRENKKIKSAFGGLEKKHETELKDTIKKHEAGFKEIIKNLEIELKEKTKHIESLIEVHSTESVVAVDDKTSVIETNSIQEVVPYEIEPDAVTEVVPPPAPYDSYADDLQIETSSEITQYEGIHDVVIEEQASLDDDLYISIFENEKYEQDSIIISHLNKELEMIQVGYEAQFLEYEVVVSAMKEQLEQLKAEFDLMTAEKTFIEQAFIADLENT